jgi:hypothetical protein
MGVSIPQPFHSVVDGPVTVSVSPTSFTIGVSSLPAIHLDIDTLPKINIGVDPIELRLTQFPSIRGHLPVDMSVCLSLLGVDLASIRLCGEAQIITEPYKPNPCERCGVLDAIGVVDVAPA